MAVYQYTAVLRTGDRIAGRESAASAAEVIARLQARSAFPLQIRQGEPKPLWRRLRGSGDTKGQASVVMTAELCTLISAGLTIDRALSIALERAPAGGFKETLVRVRNEVRGGSALADAMEAEPAVFSTVYVALVRAGEASGHLDQALGRLHAHLARGDALRHHVRSALVYPAVLVAGGFAALLLLANFVLPQFVAMFAEAHKPMPLATRLVLTANHALGVTWPFLAVLCVVIFAFARRSLRRPTTRAHWHGMLLKVPVMGALWRNADAARLARTMAALLQSGVSIPVALSLALQVLTNASMRQGGLSALGLIRQGTTVSAAMLRVAILPDVSVQLLAVGEETGRLDEMLAKQADLLEQASARRIETLLALLVPALTIAIGLMVGSVMAAVMVAVLQLNDVLG